MAPTVLQTARIFEDPEPPKDSKVHKRTTSVGDVLRGRRRDESPSKVDRKHHGHHANPNPLGERHINSPPQPKKIPLKGESESRPPMHKKSGSSTSLKGFLMGREKSSEGESITERREMSSKKDRSSVNLMGLLKKRSKKDLKENEPPSTLPSPSASLALSSPSLWSQPFPQMSEAGTDAYFQPQPKSRTLTEEIELYTPKGDKYSYSHTQADPSDHVRHSSDFRPPQRPFLEHKSSRSSIFSEHLEDENEPLTIQQPKNRDHCQYRQQSPPESPGKSPAKQESESPRKAETKNRSSKILDTITTLNMRPWRNESSPSKEATNREPLSPQDLDSAMENMLGRYDIPQNLRDQLRNLKPEVKAGLMKGERVGSGSSYESEDLRPSARRANEERPSSKGIDEKERKRSRSRSRPRSRILSLTKRGDASPAKVEGSGRSRSKSRPKSVDMSRPASSTTAMASAVSLGSLTSCDSTTTPGDFIHYLREVQKPELVEVGKIHKLRVLLRNESVAWTDAFVKKGGMDEIIHLLYRIMKLEWREEHEDTLLHHCLSCLKGLSTTSLAMQRLESVAKELFPTLLKMLFDPERKGPAEYTTRGVVVSLIFTYLSATLHSDADIHAQRAREILGYLKDAEPENDKQVLEFVSQMHTSRPYRTWHKEVNNVTKEVFWIFLHHLNVVPILNTVNEDQTSFARSYFPTARAPHPAAPYVGGVEWEATQYLANHLDLLNGIIVSLPTAEERNALREDLRQSGWEKVMGCSLRTCKEKFYAGVHDGLKAWVAAAKMDGWYVEDVRAGPPRESVSPKKSPVKGKKVEEAPKIDLDIHVSATNKIDDAWL